MPVTASLLLLATVLAPAAKEPVLTVSTPGSGTTVAALPSSVTLTFAEPVAMHPVTVAVRGPDRVRVDVGDATVAGATVTQPIRGAGTPGSYLLAYKVAGRDGHAVIGELTFTIGSADDAPWWSRTLLPGAAVLLLAAAAHRATRP
jgi:methionine-rich copper-binding protein CopC